MAKHTKTLTHILCTMNIRFAANEDALEGPLVFRICTVQLERVIDSICQTMNAAEAFRHGFGFEVD